MPQAIHPTRLAAVLASTGITLAVLVACSPDVAEPLPPESSSSSAAEPAPTEPADSGGPPEGWEDEFTDEQLQAYEAALVRWERYSQDVRPIYAKGRITPAARQFFRKNALRPQERIKFLEDIERAGLQEVQAPEPLWAKAKSVKLRPDGTGTVFITECVDYTDIRYERDGEVVKGLKPKKPITPLITQMDKPDPQSEWLYAGTELKDSKSCDG